MFSFPLSRGGSDDLPTPLNGVPTTRVQGRSELQDFTWVLSVRTQVCRSPLPTGPSRRLGPFPPPPLVSFLLPTTPDVPHYTALNSGGKHDDDKE